MLRTRRSPGSFAGRVTAFVCCLSLFFTSLLPYRLALAQNTDDVDGPQIIHSAPAPVTRGDAVTLEAIVSDATGVDRVDVIYREIGSSAPFELLNFFPFTESADIPGIFTLRLSQRQLSPPGLEYYVLAIDVLGNRDQEGSEESPLTLEVREPTLGQELNEAKTQEEKLDRLRDELQGSEQAGTSAATPQTSFPAASGTAGASGAALGGTATWLTVLGVVALGALAIGASGGDDNGGGSSSSGGTNTGGGNTNTFSNITLVP